jgi:hypothetical protein
MRETGMTGLSFFFKGHKMIQAPKFVIATDCDDVLVNTAGKWIQHILSDDALLKQIPEESVRYAISSHPMNREDFDISSHFKSGDWLDAGLKKKMLDKYFMDSKFYDDLNPSAYTIALKQMVRMGVIDSIWIVTSCIDLKYPVTGSKVRFLERVFGELKLEVPIHYVFTESGETKSHAINEREIKYSSFVDDHVANIRDVIVNTDSKDKEFLIPRYRYNVELPDAAELTEKHGANIVWFDNDMILDSASNMLCDKLYDHSEFKKFQLAWN